MSRSINTRLISDQLLVDTRRAYSADLILAAGEESLRHYLGDAAGQLARVERSEHPCGATLLRAELLVADDPSPDLDRLTSQLVEKLVGVFGAMPTAESQLAKLAEELREVSEAHGPDQLQELADVVIVCCTMAHVIGYSVPDLFDAVMAKARRNARRTWGHTGDGVSARHTEEG